VAKTSEVANGFHGEELYQRRARQVLPILVRQAQAEQPIRYEHLAEEVGMPNPRNLNYPLGCIGRALNDLSVEWGEEIPHIQILAVNKATDTPGPGFDGFLTSQGYTWADPAARKSVIRQYWTKVYAYRHWFDVLHSLNLKPAQNAKAATLIEEAASRHGFGEGPDHKRLKDLVRRNPDLIGLTRDAQNGSLEWPIPSGDRIDVMFVQKDRMHAVEVKPASSPAVDIARGLFQCVKYRAVLRAQASFALDPRKITICLALGGDFPAELVPLRNSLKVTVVDGLSPKQKK